VGGDDDRVFRLGGSSPLEEVWPEATERLRQDPAFGPVVERVGPVRLRPPSEPFAALASAIVYQQLAGKAARTIHGRFIQAVGGAPSPAAVLGTPDQAFREAGLSRGKLAAIRDLATRAASGELPLGDWDRLTDDEVVHRLTRVRGIGPWTAHMFLLFDLRRPDIWPTGDLAVRAGLGTALGLAAAPSPRETAWIGTGYRPWRSAVAWYCWRATEL
jgi:DNA-3-methyladenine glycosylase II